MVKLNKLYIDKLNGIEIQICFVFFKYSDIICLWNIFDSKNQKLIKVLVKLGLSIYAIKIILSVSFNANQSKKRPLKVKIEQINRDNR